MAWCPVWRPAAQTGRLGAPLPVGGRGASRARRRACRSLRRLLSLPVHSTGDFPVHSTSVTLPANPFSSGAPRFLYASATSWSTPGLSVLSRACTASVLSRSVTLPRGEGGGLTARARMARGYGGVPGVALDPGCRGAVYTAGGHRRAGGGGRLPPGLAEGVQGRREAVALGSVAHTAGGGSSVGRPHPPLRCGSGGGAGLWQGSAVPPPPLAPRIHPWLCRSSGGYKCRGLAYRVLYLRVSTRGVREVTGFRVSWVPHIGLVPLCDREANRPAPPSSGPQSTGALGWATSHISGGVCSPVPPGV